MNFEINSNESFTIISCNIVKLDTTVAPELKSELLLLDKSGVSNYILDLSSVKYCDSSGLSALLVGNRFAKTNEGSFVICGLQTAVEKLITISQLHNVLNITASQEDAIAYFSKNNS
jgi:anti-anti-sigma factor